jgi:hypothetical protein
VYAALSRWMKDKLDSSAALPDSIDDDWIQSRERLEAMMDRYLHLREAARNAFELRHQTSIDPSANRWEPCARVLSRRDVVARLAAPW